MKKALITLAEAGFAVMLAASPALAQVPLKVLADGPLRPGLIEIGRTFNRDSGQQVDYVFGASPDHGCPPDRAATRRRSPLPALCRRPDDGRCFSPSRARFVAFLASPCGRESVVDQRSGVTTMAAESNKRHRTVVEMISTRSSEGTRRTVADSAAPLATPTL